MRCICTILTMLGWMLAGIGCKSTSATPKPAPGRAALVVLVRAEPKAGWREESQSAYADFAEIGRSRAFETINYSALEDIVVCVAPSDEPQSTGTERLTIDVGRPGTAVHPCGLRDTWTIQNSAPEPLPIYALYESGKVVDLGTVGPGGQLTATPREAGFVQIMCDIRPDPLAQIYVAPVPTSAHGRVRVVTSGTKVVFNDLPPGPARVYSWHPRLPGSSTEIQLTPGATAQTTLVVGVNLLPKAP